MWVTVALGFQSEDLTPLLWPFPFLLPWHLSAPAGSAKRSSTRPFLICCQVQSDVRLSWYASYFLVFIGRHYHPHRLIFSWMPFTYDVCTHLRFGWDLLLVLLTHPSLYSSQDNCHPFHELSRPSITLHRLELLHWPTILHFCGFGRTSPHHGS